MKIIGTITNGSFEGEAMPLILVEKLEPAEKPDQDIIYPY